jgi:hypothetical protein
VIHILWKLTQKASFGNLRILGRSALRDGELLTRKGQSRPVYVASPLGKKTCLGLGVAGRALAAAGLAGAVGAGARGVGAGHFGRCLGGLGRKVMYFGGRSLMLDDLLQVSVSAKGKAIFIPLLTLAERSPLQSSTSTSGLGKNEIGCMGDCILKRKSPSQYPYSGLGLAHSTCLDLHVTGVAVFGPTGRYQKAPAIARTSQSAEFCSRQRIRWCSPDANRTLVLSGSHKFSSKPVSSLAVEVLHVLPSTAVVYALKRATAICFSAVI